MRKILPVFVTLLLLAVLFMVPGLAQGQGGPGTPGGPGGQTNGNEQDGNNNQEDNGNGWGDHEINSNLVLPQFAVGDNITTTVILANLGNPLRLSWLAPGDCVTSGRVLFFSGSGAPLEVTISGTTSSQYSFTLGASEVEFLEVTREGGLETGWILIEVDEQKSGSGTGPSDWGYMDGKRLDRGDRVMASAYYTITGDGGEVTSQVAVRPSKYEQEEFLKTLIPVQVSSGVNTGIALVNTGADAAKVTLRLRDATGAQADETVVDLPAGGQLAQFVTELFGSSEAFRGVLEADTESEGIVAMGLLQTGRVLTSLPVHHYGRWSRD